MLSRATVYNTLNLFTEKGLLRELVLAEGKVVFDPKLDPHHHFLDEETGEIVDVPWSALDVRRVHSLNGFDVRESFGGGKHEGDSSTGRSMRAEPCEPHLSYANT